MAHPRDTGHCPDAPEPLWRRGHRVLQDALEEEGDELEVLRSKVVVCMTAALCGGCGILWALCYCVLGAFYAAVFPATMVLVCVFSAASLLRTRRLPLARSALCHGLAFTALGIHWSFGGSGASSAVVSWAVLGPQVLRTTGASLPECLALLALLAVVLTAFGCLETFVGADSLTPQQVTLPVGWDVAFCWLNILCPGVVSFLATNMVLSQLQVHKDLLREATLTQTRLRQKDSCERTLAYELITHTFPAAIAGELFKYFQSIADDEVGPDDFPGPGYYARHSLRSPSPAGSPESPGSVRVSQSSTSVIGDYFSTFGGRHHRFTVIMFADLAGFTALATVKAAAKLVQYLDILFSHFDELCIGHKVEKIKTIGDCYMCVAWEADHESRPAATGSSIAVARQMHATIARRPLDGTPLQVRIGLHCGPVVGGIIGKTKFCYDIWGDTVNVASRMESTGQAGRTHVSADVCEVMRGEPVVFVPRGPVDVKGKGKLETYYVSHASAEVDCEAVVPASSTRDLADVHESTLPQGLTEVFDLLHADHDKLVSGFRGGRGAAVMEAKQSPRMSPRRGMAYLEGAGGPPVVSAPLIAEGEACQRGHVVHVTNRNDTEGDDEAEQGPDSPMPGSSSSSSITLSGSAIEFSGSSVALCAAGVGLSGSSVALAGLRDVQVLGRSRRVAPVHVAAKPMKFSALGSPRTHMSWDGGDAGSAWGNIETLSPRTAEDENWNEGENADVGA